MPPPYEKAPQPKIMLKDRVGLPREPAIQVSKTNSSIYTKAPTPP